MVAADGVYYAYATNAGDLNVQVATSADLVRWTAGADALPVLPTWAARGRTWAPAVTTADHGYVLYFAARDRRSGRQCIGLATGDAPSGPFRPLDSHLVAQTELGGAIDPYPFADDDGRRYLLWKSDGNARGLDTWIHLQPLSADGLRLEDAPTRLIRGDLPWEGRLVEAPTLLKRDGRYHLLYSANEYGGAAYAIGWAVADAPLGPYRKCPEPIARTSLERGCVLGPGGQDVVSKDGRTWLVYHAWDRARAYRAMNVDELTWDRGRPMVALTSGIGRPAP